MYVQSQFRDKSLFACARRGDVKAITELANQPDFDVNTVNDVSACFGRAVKAHHTFALFVPDGDDSADDCV